MRRKIILLTTIFAVATTHKASCKDDETNIIEFQPSQNLSQQNSNTISDKNKELNTAQLNQKIQTLSAQLDQLLSRIKSDKGKRPLVKLAQKLCTPESCQYEANSSETQNDIALPSAKQSNPDSLRKDIFDVTKNLTSKTQVVAFATIISLALLKKTLENGKVTEALKEIRRIVEEFFSGVKWAKSLGIGEKILSFFTRV